MKIAIAQINPTVGDIDGNFSLMATAISKAYQSLPDLIVFSELCLIGYPPKDLLERDWFIQKALEKIEELKRISNNYPEMGILFGAPTQNTEDTGKKLFNSAILIHQGEVIFEQHKSLLPTYDVFDEARYFEPANAINTVTFKDEVLGISICEDAWNDPEMWLGGKIYSIDPIEILAQKGATFFINISSSPFSQEKEKVRHRLITNHAKKHETPFLYVNQVGGNDDLIFDGNSLFVDHMGNLVVLCPSFEEHFQTVDSIASGSTEFYLPDNQIHSIYKALILGTKDYIKKCGFSKAILGLSGGIDSAVSTCIAVDALGAENVLTISMPSPFSSKGSVDDSRKLAENLGIELKVIPISGIYHNYVDTLQKHFEDKEMDETEENIQARIRGNLLMAFSNKFGDLVLSTGNKSELAVGYCTLYGDMSGGLAVLADVPKTMVYELAEYINREEEIIPQEIIEKAPSAELRPDQKDQDTLPPYQVLDDILYYHIEEMLSAEEIIAKGFEPEIVIWVIKRVAQNEYKRKQAALGLKVTTKAFGPGRRMPIAAKYEFDWATTTS